MSTTTQALPLQNGARPTVFLADTKEKAADKPAKAQEEDEDNLYYKIYAAGVVFVFLSLTFQGCIFYTCRAGVSNFGNSLRAGYDPKLGKFLGSFNETWQCEDACLSAKSTCYSFTFLTHGEAKDSLNGQCYGGMEKQWDPVTLSRKGDATAVTGVANSFSGLVGGLAALASRKGMSFGKIVGTVSDIRVSVKNWPLFAAFANMLGNMSDQTRTDMWGILYVLLLTWPLLHQLIVDRNEYHKMMKNEAVEEVDARQVQAQMAALHHKGFSHSFQHANTASHQKQSDAKIRKIKADKMHSLPPSPEKTPDFLGIELPQFDIQTTVSDVGSLLGITPRNTPTASPEKAIK